MGFQFSTFLIGRSVFGLFRNGILYWGYNLSNPNPPFCHVTDHGRKVLKNISRDPSNPDGYKAYLLNKVNLDPISSSYIEEALKTYNSDCIKASSVMVGAAAERLVLNIKESLLSRLNSIGATIPRNLRDWRIKKILNTIETIIRERKKNILNSLFESFEAYWPAFTHQIRTVRNESGHPVSIQPVTFDRVHASLLIFPELGDLADKLNVGRPQNSNQWLSAWSWPIPFLHLRGYPGDVIPIQDK